MTKSGGGCTNLRVSDERHAELKVQAAQKGMKIFDYTDYLLARALKQDRGEIVVETTVVAAKLTPGEVDIVL